MDDYKKIQEKFPFLTGGKYLNQHYFGIVENSDDQIISMYVFNIIHDKKIKELFLKYGDQWWWESNRKIPISIFIGGQFKLFLPFLKHFIAKEFQHSFGPLSLEKEDKKRIKRKNVQLIRKID